MECLQYFNLEVFKMVEQIKCFKPCYKWNAFNTLNKNNLSLAYAVLNLVISGMPSILNVEQRIQPWFYVLNLVISGMPSIHKKASTFSSEEVQF